MTLRSLSGFIASWKGIATGVTLLLALVGADGRKTAANVNEIKEVTLPQLIQTQAAVDAAQNAELRAVRDVASEVLEAIEALSFSRCLSETNPIARNQLKCGDRLRQAGLRP